MTWTRTETAISGDQVTFVLADFLEAHDDLFARLSNQKLRTMAVGYLVALRGGFAEHREDGRTTAVSDSVIEYWAGWDGKRGAFAEWVRANLVDADGVLVDWDTISGIVSRQRYHEREKKAKQRKAKQRKAKQRAHVNRDVPGDFHGDDPRDDIGDVPHLRTHERNETEHTDTTDRDDLRSSPGDESPQPKRAPRKKAETLTYVQACVELWQTYKGTIAYGRMGKALKPLVEAGIALPDQIPPQFEKYLAGNTDDEWTSPEKFAARWHDHLAGRSSRAAGYQKTTGATAPRGTRSVETGAKPKSVFDVIDEVDAQAATATPAV